MVYSKKARVMRSKSGGSRKKKYTKKPKQQKQKRSLRRNNKRLSKKHKGGAQESRVYSFKSRISSVLEKNKVFYYLPLYKFNRKSTINECSDEKITLKFQEKEKEYFDMFKETINKMTNVDELELVLTTYMPNNLDTLEYEKLEELKNKKTTIRFVIDERNHTITMNGVDCNKLTNEQNEQNEQSVFTNNYYLYPFSMFNNLTKPSSQAMTTTNNTTAANINQLTSSSSLNDILKDIKVAFNIDDFRNKGLGNLLIEAESNKEINFVDIGNNNEYKGVNSLEDLLEAIKSYGPLDDVEKAKITAFLGS